MELRDLIVSTPLSKEGKVADRIFLPSYEELIQNYHFAKEDFIINQDLHLKNETLNTYWLRNDGFTKLPMGRKLEGMVGLDGNQYPIRVERDVVYCFENVYSHKEKINNIQDYLKWNLRKLRLCMNLDIDTYLALSNQYTKYQPYDFKDANKKCKCIRLGQHFDISSGKKSKQSIAWRILNWERLPQSINPNGVGTAKTVDLISLNSVGYSRYIDDRRDYDEANLWANSLIRRDLNGYANKKHSFIDHAFKEEEILLRSLEQSPKKTTLSIDTKSAHLKEDFINTFKANPQLLNALIPAMKTLIQEAENLQK